MLLRIGKNFQNLSASKVISNVSAEHQTALNFTDRAIKSEEI